MCLFRLLMCVVQNALVNDIADMQMVLHLSALKTASASWWDQYVPNHMTLPVSLVDHLVLRVTKLTVAWSRQDG